MAPAVLEAIEDLLGRGRTPTQVSLALELDDRFEGNTLPTVKTISRIDKARRLPDPDQRWTIEQASPDEVPIVLAVFAALVRRDEAWRCLYITKQLATLLVNIHAAAPDLDDYLAYRLARKISLRKERGLLSLGIEIGLAFGPWRGDEWARQFRRVVDAHHLSELDWNRRLSHLPGHPMDAIREEVATDIDDWIDEEGIHWSGLSDEERQNETSRVTD